jgi:hypothetical protein
MPAAVAIPPPAIRVTPKARRWRYSQGAIRRCIPDRGGDRHHARRPSAALFSFHAFMETASRHTSLDTSGPSREDSGSIGVRQFEHRSRGRRERLGAARLSNEGLRRRLVDEEVTAATKRPFEP